MLSNRRTVSTAEQIRSPELQRLFAYWNSVRGGRFAPARKDINPKDIRDILGHLLLVDVAAGRKDLRIRLMGTRLVNCFDRDLTGQMIAHHQDPLLHLLESYCHPVLNERAPVLFGPIQCHMDQVDIFIHETLALPLSPDQSRINMLLMGMSCQPRSNIGPLAA
ncbi:hypothetical protein JCM17846_21920 [Iodidimonas nitroreducens]|uniref:PAS domain-containing protein n=1 Tax=Iodidimonas nitroreducens TaxID=1236968 RepID=A0A5A7NAK9_9PROT|nr:PAS domain-containing protein [Iodidimonas nitroreducens]GAK32589.1 PAS domain protein [alpha proteobacterium Q-1]GER04510.1 hypothetical protein JCM17846_21920 [Iodidimonas nitroreducens]